MNVGPWTARIESVTGFAARRRVRGVELTPSTFGVSCPPKRQAAITSAVTSRIAASAMPAPRDSWRSRRRRCATECAVGAARGALLVPCDVAGVVLLDVQPAVEPERVGVDPEEALGVRVPGKLVEALVLEMAQVLLAHLRALLHLVEVETLPHAGLAQARADLEHRGASVVAIRAEADTSAIAGRSDFALVAAPKATPSGMAPPQAGLQRQGSAPAETCFAIKLPPLAEVREQPVDRDRDEAGRGEGDARAHRAPARAGPAAPAGASEAHVVVTDRAPRESERDAPRRTPTGIAKPACSRSYDSE